MPGETIRIVQTAFTPLPIVVLNVIVMLIGVELLLLRRVLVWPVANRNLGLPATQSLPLVIALDFLVFLGVPALVRPGIIDPANIGVVANTAQIVIGYGVPLVILAAMIGEVILFAQDKRIRGSLALKMAIIFTMIAIIGTAGSFSFFFDEISKSLSNDPRQLQTIQRTIGSVAFPVIGMSVLLNITVTLFVVGRITAPLRRLTALSEQAAKGDYKTIKEPGGGLDDEVTHLTASINSMIEKVDKRETKLKREIQTLKIEIDQQKKQEQVDAITNSDFFTDLQDKAGEMRRRRRREESSSSDAPST